MSKKNQNSKKKNTKATAKKTSAKKEVKSKKVVAENEYQMSPRIKTILLGMSAVLFLALVLIPGEMVWAGLRSFLFGIFGLCVILVPVTLGYLTFINSAEKRIPFFKTKVVLCASVLVLTESLVYLIGSADYNDYNYFYALGKLYEDVALSDGYYPVGSGFLGGVLGYPLMAACGKLAAVILTLVVLVSLLLIIFKVSLRDVAMVIRRFGRNVSGAYEKPVREYKEYEEDYEDDELGIGHYNVHRGYKKQGEFDSSIDIPIEAKKKKRKRKENIDISMEDTDAAKAENPSEVFLNNIKKAEKNYSDDVTEQEEKAEENPFEEIIKEETKVEEIKPEETKEEPQDDMLMLDEIINNAVKEAKKEKKKSEYDFTPEFIEENKDESYHYPPIGLLKLAENSNDSGDSEMRENGDKLIQTLDSFGVKASITYIARGPSVTRYEIKPAPGVKISKITNLSDDIALALAAQGVRIEAPIPGKAAVGIEVPNKIVNMVSMRELIDCDEFKSHPSKLACVLGKDISGQNIITDLSKLPHLLIAGTTGSGKSVCVNALLMSILYKATPDEVKLLLIDPKMVEFSKYKGIPHLLVPVVSDAKKSAGALNWAVSEMLQRYKIFSEYDCKDIDSYNTLVQSNIEYMKENPPVVDEDSETGEMVQPVLEVNGLAVAKEKMPRIVIAIDELADLMMAAPKEVEDSIARLAQMARAAGMHLVIATQRPSVNVITGLIKANIPSRISLKVSSNIDSRTILDAGGAEKLIGRGDMLYSPVGAANPTRVQCCFATDAEIEGVTKYIKKSSKADYNAEIEEQIKRIAAEDLKAEGNDNEEGGTANLDVKMEEAIKIVIDAGQASTSMLQRRLQVGYARAGRMIDDMEKLGIVGPYQGSKPRDVLMTYNQWLERKNIIGNND